MIKKLIKKYRKNFPKRGSVQYALNLCEKLKTCNFDVKIVKKYVEIEIPIKEYRGDLDLSKDVNLRFMS